MRDDIPEITLLGSVDFTGVGIPGLKAHVATRMKAGGWAPNLLALLAVSRQPWTTTQVVEGLLGSGPGRRRGGWSPWHEAAEDIQKRLKTARSALRAGLGEEFAHLLHHEKVDGVYTTWLEPALIANSDLAKIVAADEHSDWETVLVLLDGRRDDRTPLQGVQDLSIHLSLAAALGGTPALSFTLLAERHREAVAQFAERARDAAHIEAQRARLRGDHGRAATLNELAGAAWPLVVRRATGPRLEAGSLFAPVIAPSGADEIIVDAEVVDDDEPTRGQSTHLVDTFEAAASSPPDVPDDEDDRLLPARHSKPAGGKPPSTGWLIPNAATGRARGALWYRSRRVILVGALLAASLTALVLTSAQDPPPLERSVAAAQPLLAGAPISLTRGHFPKRRTFVCMPPFKGCDGLGEPSLNAYREGPTSPSDQQDFVSVSIDGRIPTVRRGVTQVRPGDVIHLRALVSNSGARARAVRAVFGVPKQPGTDIHVFAAASGKNTDPRVILDEARLNSPIPASLLYIRGSASADISTGTGLASGPLDDRVVSIGDVFDIDSALATAPLLGPKRNGSVPPDPNSAIYLDTKFLVVPARKGHPAPQVSPPWPLRPTWRCTPASATAVASCPRVAVITLNSLLDRWPYPDERDFVKAAVDLAVDGRETPADNNAVFVKPGDIVQVAMHVHNPANAENRGRTAVNTRALFEFSTGPASPAVLGIGYVSSDNTVPSVVADGVGFYSTEPIRLRYLPGSARWTTTTAGERRLPAAIQRAVTPGATVNLRARAGDGTLLSSSPFRLDGHLEGGTDATGTIKLRFRVELGSRKGSFRPIRVRPLPGPAPTALSVSGGLGSRSVGQLSGGALLYAKGPGQKASSEKVTLRKCETYTFGVLVDNVGPGIVRDIRARVQLPRVLGRGQAHARLFSRFANPYSVKADLVVIGPANKTLTYVAGSSWLTDTSGRFVRPMPDGITSTGLTIGRVGFHIADTRYVRFKARVAC